MDKKYETGRLSRRHLSIRLGRHHNGVEGPNSLKTKLKDFLNWILTSEAQLEGSLNEGDPERVMETLGTPSGLKGLWQRLIDRKV